MVAAVKKLYIEQGATFFFGYQWVREDIGGAIAPIDITNFSIRMQIREKPGSPVLLEATTENGMFTITNPTEGRVKLNIPAIETDKLTKPACRYDIEMQNPAGDVWRVFKGVVEVDLNITQGETTGGP